jgi:hypothetical protein
VRWDADFLSNGVNDPSRFDSIFKRICALPVDEDGLQFNPLSVRVWRIKEDANYDWVPEHQGNAATVRQDFAQSKFLVTDLVTTSFCIAAFSCSTLQFEILLQLLLYKVVIIVMRHDAIECKSR